MLAALLAKRGFTGIPDIVEAGYGGFLSSFSRTPEHGALADRPRDGLGGRQGWLQDVSERHKHSCSARCGCGPVLLDEGLSAAQIKEINVLYSHMTFVHTAWDYRRAELRQRR